MRPVQPDDLGSESWLLLHEVRLRGVFEVDGGVVVSTLIESGLVSESPRGVRLTPAGRDAHALWARVEAGSELQATVERAYRRFLTINTELVRLCSDWQVRPGGMPNDHKDPEYDWGIFDRLSSIDDRVGPLVTSVARGVERFGTYRERLRTARQKVDDGGHEWLTSPRIDSYHTVWMQLHEDLLLALGKERASES
jgi:pyruvate,orthophosphate dikinase